MTTPILHSVPEAAALLGVSRCTLYELIRSRQLGSIKVGRRRLIPATSITDFITKGLNAA